MKTSEFVALKKLKNEILIEFRINKSTYLESIINSNIPFKPGVYLIYGIKNNKEDKLLYIGKAGHTGNILNAHPLPVRLLAAEPIPQWHNGYVPESKKFITRTKLMQDKVVHFGYEGLNIYCYETFPILNCNDIERQLIKEYKGLNNDQLPEWMSR